MRTRPAPYRSRQVLGGRTLIVKSYIWPSRSLGQTHGGIKTAQLKGENTPNYGPVKLFGKQKRHMKSLHVLHAWDKTCALVILAHPGQ